jgi:iron complex transport system substrate-binding protein
MRKRTRALVLVAGLAVAGSAAVCLWLDGRPGPDDRPAAPPAAPAGERTPATPLGKAGDEGLACRRVISMAPSLTETMFALGLGERLVGVTRFCTYPPEAAEKTKVGGYFDPNYETILSLNPDLVLLLPAHEEHAARLAELHLQAIIVRQGTVDEILASVRRLGRICEAEAQATELADRLAATVARVERLTTGRPRPGVLLTVGRQAGAGTIADVFVAGPGTFLDELLDLAGGTNVYEGRVLDYPTLSAEGIVDLNPQVIIELIPDMQQRGLDVATVLGDWERLPGLNAARKGRIHVLSDDYAAIPGPRFVSLLDRMARLVHPELSWND